MKLITRLLLLVMLCGVLVVVTTPQQAAVDCDAQRRICIQGAEVIEGTCYSQGGNTTTCDKQFKTFYESCMKQNGCPTSFPAPVPRECPEWCRDWYLGRCMC